MNGASSRSADMPNSGRATQRRGLVLADLRLERRRSRLASKSKYVPLRDLSQARLFPLPVDAERLTMKHTTHAILCVPSPGSATRSCCGMKLTLAREENGKQADPSA